MNNTIKVISEDEFYEKYNPVQNHLDNEASWGGTLYETFGDELDYCFELAKKENRVWTILECDDLEPDDDDDDDDEDDDEEGDDEIYQPSCLYIVSGFHYVNRIGFMITKTPYNEEIEVKLDI